MVTKHDKILYGLIIGAMLVGFLFIHFQSAQTGTQVVIEVEGEVVQVLPLGQLEPGEQIPIAGRLGNSILEVGQDKVRLIKSPCPDHICIAMGWVSTPGQVIVCLPNRVVVRIEGDEAPELDGIAG
ncbi:MAG: NusG domain II-containing protein [bacterium]|jgi:hypothetical protein